MRKELEIWKENTFKAEKSLHEILEDPTPFKGEHIDKFLEWFEKQHEDILSIVANVLEGSEKENFKQDFLDEQYENFLDDQAILEGISKWEAEEWA